MSQPYSTGFVAVYAAAAVNSTTPVFVGWTERMPKDTRNPQYDSVMSDVSGSKIPLDYSWEAEDATVHVPLTRWNNSAIENFASGIPAAGGLLAIPGGVGNTPGSWSIYDVGAMMGLESGGFTVWLVYAFGAALGNKAAYAAPPAGGLRPGRRYPQCIIWSPDTEDTGSAPMIRDLHIYAWPMYVSSLSTGGKFSGSPGFVLYDANMTGITPGGIN